MKRYVIIQDNKIVSERYGAEIVEGEIEATEDMQMGHELLNSVWQKVEVKPSYEQIRHNYYEKINEAQVLGEEDIAIQLRAEWAAIREKNK